MKEILVSLFRGLFLLGAGVIGAVVIGAVVIRSRLRHDPFHFPCQGRFNRFRLALASSYSAYVGGVEIQLSSNTAVKPPKKGREVKWGRANAAFDFCHHSCYPLPMSVIMMLELTSV